MRLLAPIPGLLWHRQPDWPVRVLGSHFPEVWRVGLGLPVDGAQDSNQLIAP